MSELYRAIELPISDDNWGLYSLLNNQLREHYKIDISYLSDVQVAQLIIHVLGHVDLADTSKDFVNLDKLLGFTKKS